MKSRVVIHAAAIAANVFLSSLAFGQADWTLKSPAHKPAARGRAAMTTFGTTNDGISGDSVVLFGGQRADGFLLGDTWVWTGTDWQPITAFSSNVSPSARQLASMAFMPASCCVASAVLFGGGNYGEMLGDTWILTRRIQFVRTLLGFSSTFAYDWTQLNAFAPSPSPRMGAAMSYDAVSKTIILSGGLGPPPLGGPPVPLNDTWSFDPQTLTWTPLPAGNTEPPARFQAAMSTCAAVTSSGAAPGPILLFGGRAGTSTYDDTWEFHPSTLTPGWVSTSPGTHPSARYGHGVAYYPVSKQAVLYGGDSGVTYSNQTWNGTCADARSIWAEALPAHNPGPRSDFGMAIGPSGFTVVLFGGATLNSSGQTVISNDTWTWGRRVACLPLDDAPLRVGSEVTCQFDLEPGIQFDGWTANGFAPPSRDQLQPVFHTEAPGPASITASWTDAQGPHTQTFNYTVVRPNR